MYSDWKSLPDNILDSVFRRLESPFDYMRCSVVCKSWHRVADENRIQQAKMMSNCQHPPMLLIPAEEEEDTWNLYNVMERKVLDMQVTVPPNYKRFSGSSKGWLIALDENFVVTLINPFYRVKGRRAKENSIIQLPPLNPEKWVISRWGRKYQHFLTHATISADPILHPDECTVVILFGMFCELAFLRLNKDKSWTYITGDRSLKLYTMIQEVVNIQNRFFALNYWDKLLSLDITDEFHSDLELVTTCGAEREFLVNKRYLMYYSDESSREWLVVHKNIQHQEDSDKRMTRKFRVFGFDLEKLEWMEKHCLGDISIFLGDNSSIAVSASKFPGCKPNCIYYNHDRDGIYDDVQPHDFGVYNFKTKRFTRPYSKRSMSLLNKSKRYPIWIVPTF